MPVKVKLLEAISAAKETFAAELASLLADATAPPGSVRDENDLIAEQAIFVALLEAAAELHWHRARHFPAQPDARRGPGRAAVPHLSHFLKVARNVYRKRAAAHPGCGPGEGDRFESDILDALERRADRLVH